MNHADLIERLEKLEGPDREVEAEIDVTLFGGETIWKTANYTMESYPASRRPSATHIGGFANEHVPSYTASLDSAVALVERVLPGSFYHIAKGRLSEREPLFAAQLLFGADEVLGEGAHRATPAIALLIATLKALQENSNG